RVAALKVRIDALQTRLADAEQRQSGYLAQVAVQELQQQKERLSTYQVQARFALATMYDRAANAEGAHQAPNAPVQKGADSTEPPAPPTPQPATPPPTPEPRPEKPQ